MLKKLIIIATLLTGMVACQSNSNAARDFNNEVVAKEISLEPEVATTESNVKRFYETQQYDSIAAAGENMESLVQKSIEEINTMPVPKVKGAVVFKTAMIRYFKFIKSLYTGYKEYGLAGSDEGRQEKLQEVQKLVSQKQDVLAEMQGAQRIFAMDNNFKLERKK